LDIPRHVLLALAKDHVAQAKAIAREQERLADHLVRAQAGHLVQRLIETVARTSFALAEQEVLIEQLSQSANDE
jgi:hypothetical protein